MLVRPSLDITSWEYPGRPFRLGPGWVRGLSLLGKEGPRCHLGPAEAALGGHGGRPSVWSRAPTCFDRSLYRSIDLSVYLSGCLFVCLSVCLSIYLSKISKIFTFSTLWRVNQKSNARIKPGYRGRPWGLGGRGRPCTGRTGTAWRTTAVPPG